MQVPYVPYPTERPTEHGPGGVSVNAPEAAFGGAVAQAVQRLGGTLEKSGDELFARAQALQNLRNETEAKEADAQYMIEAGKLHADYGALEGKNRVDAFPKYQSDLNESRQRIRASLSNDAARRMFDSSALSVMSRSIFNGAGAAASANKDYIKGANAARAKAADDAVYAAPDDATRDAALHIKEDSVNTTAEIEGWAPERRDLALKHGKSESLAHWLTGIAKREPFRAGDEFKKYQDQLVDQDRDKVLNTIESEQVKSVDRNITAKVMAPIWAGDPKKPEKPLDQLLKEGDAMADKLAPDNERFKQAARYGIERDYNRHKQSVADAKQRAVDTIESSFYPKDGPQPKTVDDLMKQPGASAAWDALDPKQQNHYREVFKKLSKPDYSPAGRTEYANSPEGLRRYEELIGKMHNDPVGFSTQSLVEERFPINTLHRLQDKQQNIKDAKFHVNQDVNQAMAFFRNFAGSEMRDLGVYNRTASPQDYDQFVGALTVKMENLKAEGKKIDDKTLKGIYYELVGKQAQPPSFIDRLFGLGPSKQSVFKNERFTDPTATDEGKKFIEGVKAKFREKGLPEPDNNRIAREWLRLQLQNNQKVKSGE